MAQIREVIESLCVVLRYNDIADITAETFRLAKFDNHETTKPMWITLKSLLFWCEMIQKSSQIIRVEGHPTKELTGTVRCCKHELFAKGYRIKSFFELPENMRNGSRAILLALGWLIAKEKLVERLVGRVQSRIMEDVPYRESCCGGIGLHGKDVDWSASSSNFENAEHRLLHVVHRLTFLKGKLDAACRSLLAAKNEYSHLLKRIHSATLPFPSSSSSTNHLSTLDVYLLYHQKELTKHQERLQGDNLYLHSLVLLKNKELSFWKWMESIFDMKTDNGEDNEEELQQCGPLPFSQESYKPSKEIQGIKTQQVEFSKLLQDQESLYMNVSTKWKRYKDAIGKSKEIHEQFQFLLSCLDQEVLTEFEEIRTDKNNLLSPPGTLSIATAQLSTLQGPLLLNAPCGQLKKKCKSDESSVNEQSVIANISLELSEHNKLLKEELVQLKKEHSNRLEEFASSLKDVVCIPPR